jgi:hypothetical protein
MLILGAQLDNYVLPLKILGWVDLALSKQEVGVRSDIRVAACAHGAHSAIFSPIARCAPTFAVSLDRIDRPPNRARTAAS